MVGRPAATRDITTAIFRFAAEDSGRQESQALQFVSLVSLVNTKLTEVCNNSLK